jgi:flagellar motor protein MotB
VLSGVPGADRYCGVSEVQVTGKEVMPLQEQATVFPPCPEPCSSTEAAYSLRPLAREKLAKVADIICGRPGLRLDVEGHTDSVGGADYNQQLSEQRGGAVRDYLTQQGMPAASVTAKGFGKTLPVAQ